MARAGHPWRRLSGRLTCRRSLFSDLPTRSVPAVDSCSSRPAASRVGRTLSRRASGPRRGPACLTLRCVRIGVVSAGAAVALGTLIAQPGASRVLTILAALVIGALTFGPRRLSDPARITVLALVALLLAPLAIALGAPRTLLYLLILAVAYGAPRLHGRQQRTRYRLWLALPFASAALGFLAGRGAQALVLGAITAGTLFAGLSLGSLMRDDVSVFRVLRGMTLVAAAAAAVALWEYQQQAPLYRFSEYQGLRPFRATGMLTHPLILTAVTCAVACANLALPRQHPRGLLIGAALPLLGAAASLSRSVAILLSGGLAAVALVATEGRGRRRVALLFIASGALALLLLSGLGELLTQRFAGLDSRSQSVRLQAAEITATITNGYQNLIGGGPGYVADALNDSPTLLRQSSGFATVDNGFFGVYATLGAIGLVGLLLAGVLFVRTLRVSSASPGQRAVAVLGLVVFFANLSFEALGWMPLLFMLAWAAGTCAPPSTAASHTRQQPGTKPSAAVASVSPPRPCAEFARNSPPIRKPKVGGRDSPRRSRGRLVRVVLPGVGLRQRWVRG